MSILFSFFIVIVVPGFFAYQVSMRLQSADSRSIFHKIFYFSATCFLSCILLTCVKCFEFLLPWQTDFALTSMTELAILVFAAINVVSILRKQDCRHGHPRTVPTKLSWFLICLVTGFILTNFIVSVWQQPIGFWDAWAIWNQRAKFVYAFPDSPSEVFSPSALIFHQDYPLFVPLLVSELWRVAGEITVVSPAVLSLLFAVGISGMVFGGLSLVASPGYAVVSVLLVGGHPMFVEQVGFQVADVPLSYALLGALLSYVLWKKHPSEWYATLCGGFCGAAPWIKNEGILFLVLVVLVGAVAKFRKPECLTGRTIAFWLLGLLPGLVAVVLFKLTLAPDGDIIANLTAVPDLNYFFYRGQRIVSYALSLYTGGLGVPVALLIVSAFLLMGKGVKSWDGLLAPIAILVGLHIGYFLVYLTSTHDIEWYLSTSANRLFVQLWPSVVLVGSLIVFRSRQEHSQSGRQLGLVTL